MANTKKYISLDKLEKYNDLIKGVISAGDEASLKSAKDYADSLAGNYDAAGAATTAAAGVQANLDAEVLRAKAAEEANAAAAKKAQDEVDALELVVAEKAAQADLEALAGKVGEVPADQTVMGIITNIQENAYDDTALKAEINTELALKADKTQVATDIAAAVKVETDARVEAIEAVQGEVDALEKVHADDKKALEDAIALKADITALDEVSAVANAAVKQADYDVKVKALEDEDARIVSLVEAEATKAREEEGKLDARLVEVETFFKTAEGETLNEALDTLVEIQKYVTDEGAAADQMVKDIAANKKAIEDHVATDHDFAGADAALKEELMVEINKKATIETVNGIDGRLGTAEGKITTVEGKVSTLEGEMDAVEAAVATKAEAQALTDAVEYLEGELEELTTYVDTKAVQADWDVNDPESPAYIKNKPFYEVQGESLTIVDYIFTEDDKFEEYDSGYYTIQYNDSSVVLENPVNPGDICKVTIDGVVYDNIVAGQNYIFTELLVYKDASNTSNENLKFTMGTNPQQYTLFTFFDMNGKAPSTLKIEKVISPSNIKQLDDKFISNNIARTADLEALATNLESVDAGQETRIAALEAKFGEGEGSVEDMIAAEIDAAIVEVKADSSNKDAVVLAEAQKGIDAVQAALDAHIIEANAVADRVTTAEGEIDTLQSEMDAVEALAAANKAAHEANATAIALKASQADLEAVAGRVTTLETWHNNFVEASEEDINALFQ